MQKKFPELRDVDNDLTAKLAVVRAAATPEKFGLLFKVAVFVCRCGLTGGAGPERVHILELVWAAVADQREDSAARREHLLGCNKGAVLVRWPRS